MLNVIDVASSQRYLDFRAPKADGYVACYVKLGGDNVPRYVAPYYRAQVDAARALGYRIGHYWVPDAAKAPDDAARYFVNNLQGFTKGDFLVLDNESFPGNDPDGSGPRTDSQRYGDNDVAGWVHTVKTALGVHGSQVLVYSGLSDARGTDWTRTLATGANFIIAAYSYAPFTFALPNVPTDRVVGHQTGGKVWPTTNGGTVAVDINSFKDHAFAYDTTTPTPEPGGAMTPEQANQLAQVYNAVFSGGTSMKDDGKSISQSLAEIQDKLDAISAKLAGLRLVADNTE